MSEPELVGEQRWTVAAVPELVGITRKRVADVVQQWDLNVTPSVLDALRLLVSELMTNGIRHAQEQCVTVQLSARPSEILFEVVDGEANGPRVVAAGGSAESGRGLFLVARLATSWGWRPAGTGKSVWFTLALPRTKPDAFACGTASGESRRSTILEAVPRPALHAAAEPGGSATEATAGPRHEAGMALRRGSRPRRDARFPALARLPNVTAAGIFTVGTHWVGHVDGAP